MIAKERIRVNNIGLVSWKFHSFLEPEENRELQQLQYLNLHQAIIDGIGTVEDQLVIRNTMSDWDYEYKAGQYVINRDVDNNRKTHIIYGMGCLDGIIPNKLTIQIPDGTSDNVHKYTSYGNEFFHMFDPMVVLRRNENADFIFDKPGNYKLYGMTCESLGAHVFG